MKTTLSVRHFEATDKLRTFAAKELDRLDKYFNGTLNCDIVLEESGNRKIVDMRLMVLGKVLPAQMDGDDFYKIIPKAVDKLESQLKSQVSKIRNR